MMKDKGMNDNSQKTQDPFSKAVMHIISKEYYQEGSISMILRELVEQCLKKWDQLLRISYIVCDPSELEKIKCQFASTLCADMQVKSIQRTTPIFFYGDKDEQIYFVIKGQVQLFIPKSEKEIWDEIDFNKRLKNSSPNKEILEEKDRFDIVVNAIQKMKGSHIDLIKQNEKLRKKYFDEEYQVSRIKKVDQIKSAQMFGEMSYLLDKPRPYTAIVSEELYCAIFEPKTYRKALGEYFSYINSKIIYLNNCFSSNIRKETLFHLSVLFNNEIKLHLGDFLFKEGEQGNRIYMLMQGKIEFQRRLATPQNLQKKKIEFKKIQNSIKDLDAFKNSQNYFSVQSLTQFSYDEELESNQEGSQNMKRNNKKKKTVQMSAFSQSKLNDDSMNTSQSNIKNYDTTTTMSGNQKGQSKQSLKMIKSITVFDDLDLDNDSSAMKSNQKGQSNDKNNFDELKYKDVSLGVICQGEFFGFEDILISSSNNYQHKISQNRRTYSAKIISSDAIIFSIERSTFLKMLTHNQALDQDVKTKALVKISYHQQRIDSLKRFEDSKQIIYRQKVPLKEMLKDRYISMDLRPNLQNSSYNQINNFPKGSNSQILKINLDSIDSNSTLNPQSTSNKQSQPIIMERNEKGQKKMTDLSKKSSIQIKQDTKICDDIDNYNEFNIPKDISKGNVQFLRFHNGQFSDLKSMKQSYLDQEERNKQIKKTKHLVNINDENQLTLERIYSMTNSPSIKNFKEILQKKNTSIVKSSFVKSSNNILEGEDGKDENENRNELEVFQKLQSYNSQQNETPLLSPSHKKLQILTKKQSSKQNENSSYNLSSHYQSMTLSLKKELNLRDKLKEKSFSQSFIKLEQVATDNDSIDIKNQQEIIKGQDKEIFSDNNSSLISHQRLYNPSNNEQNTDLSLNYDQKMRVEDNSSIFNGNNRQKLSFNTLSDNAKLCESQDDSQFNQYNHNANDDQFDIHQQQIILKNSESITSQQSLETPPYQLPKPQLNLLSSNFTNQEQLKNNKHLHEQYQDQNAIRCHSNFSPQKLNLLPPINPINVNNMTDQQKNRFLEIDESQTVILESQNQRNSHNNNKIDTDEENKSDKLYNINKTSTNQMARSFNNQNYVPPKIFLSPSESQQQLNDSLERVQPFQSERIMRLQNKYQQSLVDFDEIIPSSDRNNNQNNLQCDLDDRNINNRSKSLNHLENVQKEGSFSSFLPSLLNLDIGMDQQNRSQSIQLKVKQKQIDKKQQYQQQNNRVRSKDQKLEVQSQQSIYFNQFLHAQNNAQNIINEVKQHLSDKKNSSDISTYIQMRNHSLPSLHIKSNSKDIIPDQQKQAYQQQIDAKYSSPLKNINVDSKKNYNFTSHTLQKNKLYHFKLRNFEINLDGSSLKSNPSPTQQLNHNYNQIFSSKTSKKSDDYFKHLFSKPRIKQQII